MKRSPLTVLAATAATATLVLTGCGQEGSPTTGGAAGGGATSGASAPTYDVAADVALTGSPTFDKITSAGRVVVGVKADQPGLGLRSAASGEYAGFDIEIAKLVAASLGLTPDQIEFKETVSANREPFLQQGQVDMVVATYTINDKRKEVVDFAGPYYVAGQDLLVRKDDTSITGPDSLAGKKVCSVEGSTPATRIETEYPQAQLVKLDTYSKCVDQLTANSVDAVTTDDAILRGYAAQQPDALKVVGAPFSEEPYGIGLPKGDTVLRGAVNDAIEQAVTDGDWKAAYDFTLGGSGTDPEPPTVDRY
ncbi:glutamate ABC transporter substrate-binding protein [Kineococcus indalonis]|uniref:glutamate ABC transporter substrate-binding protein n=1 Tax=Kineococcus indalonis TaxID=2696566 RepID=UPI00141249AD|nr:glutamate ABC transporter substrate-binding protein [Kineococcus indalonis]NAZ85069.1 transporter substrate-binding domain-containing protein [Kineococcus indalonis]